MDEIHEIAALFRTVCQMNRAIASAAKRSAAVQNVSEHYEWSDMVHYLTSQRDETLHMIDLRVWG